MGMFDHITTPVIHCSKCGDKLDSFQSKDGPCLLEILDFHEVNNFYVGCHTCGAWHEFDYDTSKPRELANYTLTINRI